MWIRRIGFGLLAALAAGLAGGCKKQPAPAVPLLKPPVETVARVHWLGKQRLASDTNAATFMGIWELPESKTLEAQTLDRLAAGLLGVKPGAGATDQSSAHGDQASDTSHRPSVTGNQPSPAGSRPGITNPPMPIAVHSPAATNRPVQLAGPAALLRPLLDDLVQQEWFLTISQATNLPGQAALAIRLNDERGRLWQTNLAALLESLTQGRVGAVPGRTNGWQLLATPRQPSPANSQSPAARTYDLARAGEWTLVGLASGRNELLEEMLEVSREAPDAVVQAPKGFWLFAEGDLRRAASALSLGWDPPAGLPKLRLGVNGDGQTVHTRAQLDFAKPLPFELEPWNIPTNLVHEPLVSFTAIQGIQSWLASSKLWQSLDLGVPPNQLYLWAQGGLEFLSYAAAPMTNAGSLVERATQHLLQKPNAYLAAEGMGRFERATNGPGVIWSNVLIIAPYLRPVDLSGGDFVSAGLLPSPFTNRPPAPELLRAALGNTNLVSYDWELTGKRLDQWLYFGQLIRFALHLAQVPPESVSFAWLKALEPKLLGSVTVVKRTGPAQLSLTRRSELGFTAAELDLLADWLESPQFPRGLNTFLGEPIPLPRPRPSRVIPGLRTNSIPPVGH